MWNRKQRRIEELEAELAEMNRRPIIIEPLPGALLNVGRLDKYRWYKVSYKFRYLEDGYELDEPSVMCEDGPPAYFN